jgi:hypothetical protein
MRVSVIVSVAVFLVSGASKAADNAACWDDATRVESAPLTEKLLSSLKVASRQSVMKAMKAEGRPFSPDELHFISNAKRGDTETGILNVTFRDDRVVIIDALVDQPGPPPLECIWNAELGWCSDFPGSNEKCNK